jgi:hypothetical protein
MDPNFIATGIARFGGRLPGTDSERRTARWLQEVMRGDGRDAELEPLWVRPQWPLVHAFHAAAGVVASVAAVSMPEVGLGLAAAALLSLGLDLLGLAHLVRRGTPQRATQNVVSPPTAATRGGRERIVRLVIAAHYDAGRGGAVYREGLRRLVARARRATGGRIPGPGAGVAAALVAVGALAGVRLAGVEAGWLGVAQLVPTVALLAALAVLIDIGLSGPGPAANDPASGAAVALALAGILDRDPPRRLAVEVVLAGAGEGPSLGMRGFVRARRRRYAPEATVVLHLAACGRGQPRWWVSDGPLLPLAFHPRLRQLAAAVGRDHGAVPYRGRGAGAGWRARAAGWPAITVGSLTDEGWAPDSHRPADTPERLDQGAMDRALDFALDLVRALDEDLASRAGGRS